MTSETGPYELAAWHDYFVAAAGATAALSGLIFDAVSINLRTILDVEQKAGSSHLTGRALESLVALLVVPGTRLMGLDPSLGRPGFTIVVLAAAVLSPSCSSPPTSPPVPPCSPKPAADSTG